MRFEEKQVDRRGTSTDTGLGFHPVAVPVSTGRKVVESGDLLYPHLGVSLSMPNWAVIALIVVAFLIIVPGVLFESARFLVLFGAVVLAVVLVMWLVQRPSNRL